jgi:EAL domain-containing protein (putative c-di-GMP-specific phosphodiesterase class I)
VRAVVEMGARLGATITAEGIETGEQLECVREMGCAEVQGFLLGRPLPAAKALPYTKGQGNQAAA